MGKTENQPHGAPRCGAKNRRGTSCTAFAMRNGRCRFHGGLSTGPKTPEGKARAKRGNWKHGEYSAEARARRREVMRLFRASREFLKSGL